MRDKQTECTLSLNIKVAVGMQQAKVNGTCDELIEFALLVYLLGYAIREDTVSCWILKLFFLSKV